MTRREKPRVPFPFLPIILAMAGGIFLGSIAFTSGDSWVNGTNYIYPNMSWSDNVNITGNLTVHGQFVCLADGSNCPNLSGNGTQGPAGTNGTDGTNGTGILYVYVLSNGSLQINLTDGRNITSGNLTGLKGNTGSSGSDGANGADGVGIAAIYTLNNGSLQVNLTNGVNTTSGNLSGVKGDTGAPGGNGINGLNGTGINSVYVLSNGSLQINLTNGTNITSGNLTGLKGDTGAPGGGGSSVNNITYATGFRSLLFGAPAAVTLTGINATARCTTFPIESGTSLSFDSIKVAVDTTNASVGIFIAVYNCTSATNTFDCTSGSLLINNSVFSIGASAMQGPVNTSGNWTLPAGNYVTCISSNTTNGQSTIRGSTGSSGTGSTLRIGSMLKGGFNTTVAFTATEADAVPYTYLYRSTGVVG